MIVCLGARVIRVCVCLGDSVCVCVCFLFLHLREATVLTVKLKSLMLINLSFFSVYHVCGRRQKSINNSANG